MAECELLTAEMVAAEDRLLAAGRSVRGAATTTVS